ncbi:MAG: DUF6544 family protein [Chitinophagaceae bacterium]
MLKYIFALVIFLHGLIHFMGFAKAISYDNIGQITKNISKPAGFTWFVTAILFITAAVLFLLKKQTWPLIAIITAFLSQVLIFTVWKDAKFGTLANIMILLVAVPAYASHRFDRKVKEEVAHLLAQPVTNNVTITDEMLYHLPPIVQKWLTGSGVIGKEKIQFVRLKQKGEMRTKPGGKWLPFTATQYFTVNEPQFIWKTKLQLMPLITMTGRDKFVNGNGEMIIKVLSLVNVVKVDADNKLNSATMIRYLAETTWFPAAALNDYIKWEPINSTSAKAIMTYKGITVSGTMKFTENGDLLSFEADRYKDTGTDASLEKWLVETIACKDFNGIRIPYKSKVTWKLKEGDFNWANMELTSLEFNKPQAY